MTTSLIVSDIENTVFDWAGLWANAFDALITRLAADTGIANAGIRDAFVDLVQRGVTIVGYTESDAALTAVRLTRMGLAGVIRQVFGRVSGAVAAHREYALIDSASRCAIATDVIPYHDNKPNPAGLDSILKRYACTPDRALYLGDDLWNDVAMAQRAGVRALWAKYATARTPEQRTSLQRVAPWPGLDLSAGRGATADAVRPDATLTRAVDLVKRINGFCSGQHHARSTFVGRSYGTAALEFDHTFQ